MYTKQKQNMLHTSKVYKMFLGAFEMIKSVANRKSNEAKIEQKRKRVILWN